MNISETTLYKDDRISLKSWVGNKKSTNSFDKPFLFKLIKITFFAHFNACTFGLFSWNTNISTSGDEPPIDRHDHRKYSFRFLLPCNVIIIAILYNDDDNDDDIHY